MFRVAVAALVFVASFHPPVQSQWSQRLDRAPDVKTAESRRVEPALDGQPVPLVFATRAARP